MRETFFLLFFCIIGIWKVKTMNKTFTGHKPNKRFFIYPGTNWCGLGNKSPDGHSLGPLKAVDACCRAHDKCPDYIYPSEHKYGLVNTGCVIRFNCRCDRNFYYCLRRANTKHSNEIGYEYFTNIASPCFTYVHKLVCVKYYRRRCVKYGTISNTLESYQWRLPPMFLINGRLPTNLDTWTEEFDQRRSDDEDLC